MKIENWNGYNIRFVEKDGEWWAVLKDVCDVLGLQPKHVIDRLDDEVVSTDLILDTIGRRHEMTVVSEFGIYDTIFSSRKAEAKEFKKWVFSVIKEMRSQVGLEGFQVFRMLDKEHQKEAMSKLCHGLDNPERVEYMKANTIANKTVSSKFGFPKMVKKGNMSPEMLIAREHILEDTVELMAAKNKFDLDVSVSDHIKRKHGVN